MEKKQFDIFKLRILILFSALLLGLFCNTSSRVVAQNIQATDVLQQEQLMLTETKQVNQFFRRFNNEEDSHGVRYAKEDKRYRENGFRKKYMPILFDENNRLINTDLKEEFIQAMTSKENPQYLRFEGGEWYAEVNALFHWEGELKFISIYLTIEPEGEGYQWILTNVRFTPFEEMFVVENDSIKYKSFLHPLSHEIDFMNLDEAFQDRNKVWYYTSKNFTPDYLSIFLYELAKKNLTFIKISNVRFHFIQPEGWYFSIDYFNRSSRNSGWLISNLLSIDPKHKKELKILFGDE